MRAVRDRPNGSRLRTLLLVLLGVLFVLFLSASGTARLYTDFLWFQNLELSSVWTTIIGTKLVLGAIFTLIFFAIFWVNLYLADRFAPEFRPESPEEDLIERYHQLVDGHANRIRVTVAAVFAIVAGVDTSSNWQMWILFRNGGEFGYEDPLHGRDAGFYVFRLPFWTFLVDWFFFALVFAVVVALIAHYLNGGIRASGPNGKATSAVKIHLSGILALLALLRAVAYYLDRFELVNARRGTYDGALATDVEVQLPALNLLMLISVFGAALFVINIWRKGWALPVVAIGLWTVVHLVAAGIYPALFQRLRVEPVESVRELTYIGDNQAATLFAYGLDNSSLTTIDYAYSSELTTADVEAAADVIDDVSLVDQELTAEAFAVTQAEVSNYKFPDQLDIDRYEIDGEIQPVVLAVRNLNLDGIGEGWEREHVSFTHGYGVAVAAGDQTAPGGLPDYLVEGIGPFLRIDEGLDETLDQPQVYFAEDLGGYAIVGASRDEVNYVGDGLEGTSFRYDGDGGVPMGSMIRRLAFSLRFQSLDPLISNFIQDETAVIYRRDIEDRVAELAPFLEFDSDPYPVLAEGRVFWVVDAYTTTNNFPYSQKVDTDLAASADLASGYNYVRNSVKVVVDGYDGDVQFYVIDEDDPIIDAYVSAFPDLFSSADEIPQFLTDHLRYPSDIFEVQSDMWATYQVKDPVQFLEGALAWKVAAQPTTEAGDGEANTNSQPMEPQYRTTRLPGETETEFILQRGFVPVSSGASGRPELTGILVARSTPENYGQLLLYNPPRGTVFGPALVDSEIRKESDISAFITLRAAQGSRVRFGEMQMVLLDTTVLYVRPLYIQAESTVAVPQLDQVIVMNGSRIAMRPTLDEAIAAVTTDGGETTTAEPDAPDDDAEDDPPISNNADLEDLSVAELVQQADGLLDLADRAEAEGDTETAATLRREASAALERLQEVLGIEPDSSPISGDA